KRAGVARVLGSSPEPAERAAAAQQGAVDDAPARVEEVARGVDLLVLAAPPAANVHLLESLRASLTPRTLVTDAGSVKRAIVARAEALGLGPRFAGSRSRASCGRAWRRCGRSAWRGSLPPAPPAAAVRATPPDSPRASRPCGQRSCS